MYMRMVHVKVKGGQLDRMREQYRDRIIPALAGVTGCRYAALMQSAHHEEECISLTLWDSEEESLAYERSGLFETLLSETRPFLLDSTESRLQLSADLTLEEVPVPEEPVVSGLPVAAQSDELSSQQQQRAPGWVPIVSLKLRPGKREEFERHYRESIIPTLRSLKGCRYIYLSQRSGKSDEVISVTSWESKEDAEDYERSGLFMRLLEMQKETLSELYQWKFEKTKGNLTVTSEDTTVEHFDVVVGKAFK